MYFFLIAQTTDNLHAISHTLVITFYSPICLVQETAKGPFRSSSQAATFPPVYCKRWKLHSVPFNAQRQTGKL